MKKGISNETPLIEDGHKVYIHSDNYPSYALPNLFEYLNCDGAKARADDTSYLSAWFVAYHATNRLLKYNVSKPEGLTWRGFDEFYKNYEAKGEDILNTSDFTGIGLENLLATDADYTYVILNDGKLLDNSFYGSYGFRIFIFDRKFNFIDEIHSTDDLEELKTRDWWD